MGILCNNMTNKQTQNSSLFFFFPKLANLAEDQLIIPPPLYINCTKDTGKHLRHFPKRDDVHCQTSAVFIDRWVLPWPWRGERKSTGCLNCHGQVSSVTSARDVGTPSTPHYRRMGWDGKNIGANYGNKHSSDLISVQAGCTCWVLKWCTTVYRHM